ncbi:helix-turn-helix domain-containing protein [Nostoc sp. FACHB-133]|uniref:helix-turn-helix domain-containing protein n=1 Tax=Nostoc sp. FACHB-133 TaxID=2692835 RepID=UPI001684C158|nr:helix-turn-helix domain-containing protein [Nostoc sp. FACHB-133]MBD2527453.1 helix-turn-helix domain-containing protein [Nostoc sp. FACHB-133]
MSRTQKEAAIVLLAKGMTQAETARKLGVSRQNVSYWLKCPDFQAEVERVRKSILALQEVQPQPPQPQVTLVETIPIPISEPSKTFKCALRERELLLLEKIEMYLMPQLLEGSVRAAGILLKVSERRAKLLGLERKPYELLEAFQVLVEEGCIPVSKMSLVRSGLDELQQKLKEGNNPPQT